MALDKDQNLTTGQTICLYIKEFWVTYLMVLIPLLFIPILYCIEPPLEDGDPTDRMKVLYLLCVMGFYWLSQALPLPITALMPLAYLPMAGIQSTKNVAINNLNSTTLMFVGGLIMAIGIEESNLHRRIAINAMRVVGTKGYMMMIAFMCKPKYPVFQLFGNCIYAYTSFRCHGVSLHVHIQHSNRGNDDSDRQPGCQGHYGGRHRHDGGS